jgi:galactose mutarotase-like enzyme
VVQFDEYHLGDHGEVWRKSWERTDSGENPLELSFKLDCETYPMRCVKSFSLDKEEPILTIDYEIRNLSSKKLPFIFKLHPAIKIEEGDRFLMPSATMIPVSMDFSRILGKDLETSFPVGLSYEGKRVTIDTARPFDGFSRDFVRLQEFESGLSGIYSSRGQKKFSIKFNPKDFPYLWLFQSYGGFRGHYVSMIEPSNSGSFDLQKAFEENTCDSLLPEEVKRFHVEIMIESL